VPGGSVTVEGIGIIPVRFKRVLESVRAEETTRRPGSPLAKLGKDSQSGLTFRMANEANRQQIVAGFLPTFNVLEVGAVNKTVCWNVLLVS
jgi:hypothetical protein